jgi:hypothetical protein
MRHPTRQMNRNAARFATSLLIGCWLLYDLDAAADECLARSGIRRLIIKEDG